MTTTTTDTKENSTPGLSESASLLGETVASPPEPEMRLGKCWNSSRRLQVDIFFGLFGVSSWLAVNALFNQLPILVQTAPEGWNLPSYLSIIIQMANISLILYSMSQKYCPNLIPDTKLIYFMLVLSCSSLILMGFHYDKIWTLNGQHYSVVLFILAFCFALVGCLSSVLFIPFMNHYPEVYLISYMVGEGLSGLVPSIISLIQGVGGNPSCINSTTPKGEVIIVPSQPEPHFSTEVFFMLIFSIQAVSTVAFFLLNNLPICKQEKLKKPSIRKSSSDESPALDMYREPVPIVQPSNGPKTMSSNMYTLLLVIQSVVSAFSHGALPSIQSYSCLPYGNLVYHFAVNLGNMANPGACFLAFFMPHLTIKWIFSLLVGSAVAISYVFTTALMSPTPPLQNSYFGMTLIVFTWVACSGMIAYVKMSVATLLRREGGRGLFWYGTVTQVGGTVGSVILFFLINHTHIFTSYQPCR